MATFPILSTGAVTQYPAVMNSGQGSQVIRFLDGTDQRYLMQARALRQWQIRVDLLNEDEIQQIEAFFAANQGDYSTFVFPDPFTGAPVANCRFGTPQLLTECAGVDASSTAFWVIETNG